MENKRKRTCRVVKELPNDCWSMICSFLEDQKDFQAIILSNKGFFKSLQKHYELSCSNIDFVMKMDIIFLKEPKVFVTRLSYKFQNRRTISKMYNTTDKLFVDKLTKYFPNLKFLSLMCRDSSEYRISDLPQLEKLVLKPENCFIDSPFEFHIECANLQILRIQEENFFEEGDLEEGDLEHRGLVDFSTEHKKLTTVELCFGYRVNDYQKLPNLNSHEVDILSYLYEIQGLTYVLKREAIFIPKLKKFDLCLYHFPDKQIRERPFLELPKGLESFSFVDHNQLKEHDEEDEPKDFVVIIDFVLITQHIRSTIQKIHIEIPTFRTSHMKSIDEFPVLRILKVVSSITIREVRNCPNLEKIIYSEISGHSQSSDSVVGNNNSDKIINTQIFLLDEVPKLTICSLVNISFKTLELSRNVSSLDFLELVKWGDQSDDEGDRDLKIMIISNKDRVKSPTTLLMYSDNQKFKFNDLKFLYDVKEIVLENSRLEYFPSNERNSNNIFSVKINWESFQYFGVGYVEFRADYFDFGTSFCSPIKLVLNGTTGYGKKKKEIDGGCLDEIKSLHLLETHSLQQIKMKNLEEIVVESTITLTSGRLPYYDIKYRELKITDNFSLERLNIVLGKERHEQFQKIVLSRSSCRKKKHLKVVFETSCDGYEKKLRVFKSWGLLDEDSLPYSGQRIHRIREERVEGLVAFGKGYEDDVSVFVNISDSSQIFVNELEDSDEEEEEDNFLYSGGK